MTPRLSTVISASRRTDIPAFYMPWFMSRIEKGHFETVNPYNRKVSRVPAGAEQVHTIVFWSKNFGPFLAGNFGERLLEAGYHLFFNFTVNASAPVLEPNVPPLAHRLDQMKALCRRFGPRAVTWRFDPVCVYRMTDGSVHDNLSGFDRIARAAARCGVTRCITSFVDDYAKIRRRTAAMDGFSFVDPPVEQKASILMEMHRTSAPLGVALSTCCERQVMDRLPPDTGIRPSACISGPLLKEIYGGPVPVRKDAGQRVKQGCGCTRSVDIGAYDRHPCYHNCLFCYANPTE